MPAPKKAAPEPKSLLEELAEEASGKTLRYKIGLVQHHIGHVEKTGQVSFSNTSFSHMQEHGLIQELRPLCRAVKIAYCGGCMETGAGEQSGNKSLLDFALTVFDMESPAEITRHYPNIGVDNADKGFNKAYTGAMKYALQKFFAIPTEDIDDNETVAIAARSEAELAAEQAAKVKAANTVPAKDVTELRQTIADTNDQAFIKRAMNKVKTYGVDRVDQMTPSDFMEFGQWVEHQIANARAAQE